MRKTVEPPPSSQCDCGGLLALKRIDVAQSTLGLISQVYVCGTCGTEQSFVAPSDTYAPRTHSEQRYG